MAMLWINRLQFGLLVIINHRINRWTCLIYFGST